LLRLAVEAIGASIETRRSRTAALVTLQSLLCAGRAAFQVQVEHRDRLAALLESRDASLTATSRGYERAFVEAFPSMTAQERDLHLLIRSITVNTFKPLNEKVLVWLRSDTYFKAPRRSGLAKVVSRDLAALEAHLLLWEAKYQAWIPAGPGHALIYLADEERHGIGWPRGIEDHIALLLSRRSRLGG